MSREDTQSAANAAVKAAAAAMPVGQRVAVVVIVRELTGGLSVGSNIVSDRAALLRILKEGADAIRGDGIVIV